ncbi:MAG: glycosyltransferase family 87 protein [Gemmataceae bacterium]
MSRRAVLVPLTCLLASGWYALGLAAFFENGIGCDVNRQWIVCQYVRRGTDPYALAHATLKHHYGDVVPAGMKLYDIPRTAPPERAAEVIPELGPPEATYPPSAIGLLLVLVGWLPDWRVVLGVWPVVNALGAGSVIFLLARRFRRPGTRPAAEDALAVAWLFLLFAPSYSVVEAGQFTFLILASLLVACRREASDWLAGPLLALALIKPSLTLPFLAVPVLQKRWLRLGIACGIHALALGGVAWLVERDPLTLMLEWLRVTPYLLPGMYSMQEVVNALGWQTTLMGKVIPWALLLTIWLVAWLGRGAGAGRLFAFLGVASMLWIYHGAYDFVSLLPALLLMMGWIERGAVPLAAKPWWTWNGPAAGVVCYLVLTVALSPPIVGGGSLFSRGFRWLGRATLVYLLAVVTSRLFEVRATIGNGAANQGLSAGAETPSS